MLLNRKKLVLQKIETSYGEDAIGLVAIADRGQLALGISEASYAANWQQIDRQLASGTLSRDVTPVGHGEAQVSMTMDLRGSGDVDTEPEYGDSLRACGMQRSRATVIAVETITVSDIASVPRVPGPVTKFIRGEQLFGEVTLSSASWDTLPGNSSGTGTAPSVGDRVEFWPPTGSESQPRAAGTVMAIAGTQLLVRIDFGDPGRPRDGWFVKNLAATGYMSLAEDMPVAIVLDLDEGGAADGTLWCFVAQGEFVAGDEVSAHINDVVATISTGGVSEAGNVYRPDSEMLIQCTVNNWTALGGGAGTAPTVGTELQRTDVGGGPVTAHAYVYAVDGNTLTLHVSFGDIGVGARLINPTTLHYATVQASPAPTQVRTPSVTLYALTDTFYRKAAGCRGTFQLQIESGNPGTIQFEFQGVPRGELRLPRPDGIATPKTVPPSLSGGYVELLGYRLRNLSFALNMNNELVREANANEAGGTQGFVITGRNPELSVTVERPGHKGWQFEEAIRGGTWRTFAAVVGKTAGNRNVLVVPRMQVSTTQDGDESGIATVELGVMPRRIDGDDELFLLFR